MLASERENKLYLEGKRCKIAAEETFMMDLLGDADVPDKTLLDIGCGTGEITFALEQKGYKTFGVDFSSEAINIAKKSKLDCQLVDVDQGLPMPDNSYDIVWAGDVIEHVFDPILVLSEISRVLKQDGCLYATIPYDLTYKTRIKTLFGVSYQEGVYRKFNQFKHHTFFSENLMRYMFNTAGLEISRIYYVIDLQNVLPQFGRERKLIKDKKMFTKFSILRMFSYLMIIEAHNK